MLLMLLPAVSFCVLASSIGSKLRGQTGEWPVDVVALAAPIRLMDHILGFQERHSRREGSARARADALRFCCMLSGTVRRSSLGRRFRPPPENGLPSDTAEPRHT